MHFVVKISKGQILSQDIKTFFFVYLNKVHRFWYNNYKRSKDVIMLVFHTRFEGVPIQTVKYY